MYNPDFAINKTPFFNLDGSGIHYLEKAGSSKTPFVSALHFLGKMENHFMFPRVHLS